MVDEVTGRGDPKILLGDRKLCLRQERFQLLLCPTPVFALLALTLSILGAQESSFWMSKLLENILGNRFRSRPELLFPGDLPSLYIHIQ